MLVIGPGHAVTLQDVVQDTVMNNPDVLIAGSERQAVEQQMEQARSGFFPQADLTLGTGWESSDNPTTRAAGDSSTDFQRDEAEISIRQLLYDGSGTLSEYRRQRARVNSRAYETFSTAEVTALRAVEAYLDVTNEQQLVRLAVNNVDSHQKTYDRIVKRGNRGVGSKADVQQSLGRLALARTNLKAQENKLQDAKAAFISIVGYEPAGLDDPQSRNHLLPATLDEALEMGLANHPRLKSAGAEVNAAREQLAAAQALFFPRVHLEISGSDYDSVDGVEGNNRSAEIMLRGRYSLTGGRDTARRQQTAYQLDQAKEVRAQTRRQISEGIRLAWNAYDTARSQLEDFKLHVDASTKALQAYRKQFTIGQRTLVDLLDQENEVFQANINYANGLNDLMFAEYRILAGTGRLLWALEVPLPEQANTLE